MTATTQTVHIATIGRSATRHLIGLRPTGTYGAEAGFDTGRGHVAYAPESACPAVTRGRTTLQTVNSSEFVPGRGRVSTPVEFTAEDALAYAAKCGWQVCTTCTAAAH